MIKHSFSDFSYAVNIDSAKKGYKEVLVCYIYNGIEVLRKVYIPEGPGISYVFEARKIIDQEIKDGTLSAYSHKFISRNRRKKIQPKKVVAAVNAGKPIPEAPKNKSNGTKWIIITAGVAALLLIGATLTTYFVTKGANHGKGEYDVVFHIPNQIEPVAGTEYVSKTGTKYECNLKIDENYKYNGIEVHMGGRKLNPMDEYTFLEDNGTLDIAVPTSDVIHITVGAISKEDAPVSDYTYEGTDDVTITGLNLPTGTNPEDVLAVEIKKTFTDSKGTHNVVGISKGILEGYSSIKKLIIPFVGLKETPDESLAGEHLLGALFGDRTFKGAETLTYQDFYAPVIDPETGEEIIQHYLLPAAMPSSLSEVEVTNASVIPMGAFSNCSYIQTITIDRVSSGNSVTEIKKATCHGCRALKNFSCPNTITEVGESAFEACQTLSGFDFDGVTKIDKTAFKDCYNLANVYLPNTVTTIGEEAFGNYEGLIKVQNDEQSLPAGWDKTWAGSTSAVVYGLESPDVAPITDSTDKFSCLIVGSDSSANGKTAYIVQFLGDVNTDKIVVGDADGKLNLNGVDYPVSHVGAQSFMDYIYTKTIDLSNCSSLVSVGSYGFAKCYDLETVKFNASCPLTTIGTGAFALCGKLKNASSIFPAAVTTIGDSAFKGCASLTSLDFSSATSVGNNAFEGCSSLTEVKLSSSGVTLGDSAFCNCANLSTITYKPTGTIPSHCFENTSLTTISVPDGITSIGDYAFAYCSKATSISVGSSTALTSIGSNAFLRCKGVTGEVIFDTSNLKSIGSSAFQDCYRMEHIQIKSNKLTEIADSICYGDSELISFVCSGVSEIKSIGAYAFAQDQAFTYLGAVQGGNYNTSNNELSTKLGAIGDRAFINCVSLGRQNATVKTPLYIKHGADSPDTFDMGEQVFYGCYHTYSGSNYNLLKIASDWTETVQGVYQTKWGWTLTQQAGSLYYHNIDGWGSHYVQVV